MFERLPRPGPLAVVGDRATWRGGPHVIPKAPESVEELGRLAETLGITQFWLHESALAPLGFPPGLGRRPPREGVAHPFSDARGEWVSSKRGLAPWSYYYRRGGSGFDLHIPAYASRDCPWRGVRSAAELLVAVSAFYGATRGVRWCGTGAITSDVFLRQRLRDRLAPTQCPPPIEDKTAAELAMVWHRAPTLDERSARYVHALDLNLAYAAAASSIELPTGPVERVEWPRIVGKPRPGLYCFEPGPWPYAAEPAPWVRSPALEDDDGALWVTAPTAERMAQLGYEPIEAWLWPAHGRHLRPWYEMLRDARTELLADGGPALEALKQVCRWGLGRLAADEARTLPRGAEYLEDDPAFQPYWAWAVIAETRCRLQRRIANLDVLPLAVDTDALYFASDLRSPKAVALSLGLPWGDGLGQYKGGGSAAMDDALGALDQLDSAAAVGALRKVVTS